MKKNTLKEYISDIDSGMRPKGGVTVTSGTIPSLGAEHLNDEGRFKLDNIKFITYDFYKSMNKGKIQKDNILLVKDGATTGKVSFIDDAFPYDDAAINEHLFRIVADKAKIYPKYLFWYLFSPLGNQQIMNDFRGATVGGISRNIIEIVDIPVPDKKSLSEQIEEEERIATMLDKADDIRQKRRESLRLCDEYLRSVFLDMFGDPVTNPKGWEVKKLGEFTSLVTSGSTPLGGDRTYLKEGVPFIRSQNVLMNKFDFSDVAYISKEVHNQMKRSQVKKNDILFNITGASIGRISKYTGNEANVNQHVCIIRLNNEEMLEDYLTFFISNQKYQNMILSRNAGATRQAFNYEQIKNFDIQKPDIKYQTKFSEIFQKIQTLKSKLQTQITESENLFNSLMQRAFRGEI